MNEEELRNFCIEHNLPFAIEFKEPWYPKPIEIPQRVINDTKKLIEIFNKAIREYFYSKKKNTLRLYEYAKKMNIYNKVRDTFEVFG